jgi:hypothetical protein
MELVQVFTLTKGGRESGISQALRRNVSVTHGATPKGHGGLSSHRAGTGRTVGIASTSKYTASRAHPAVAAVSTRGTDDESSFEEF